MRYPRDGVILENIQSAARRVGADRASVWFAIAASCLAAAALINSLLGPPMIFSDEYSYLAAAARLHAGQPSVAFGPAGHDLPNRLFFVLYAFAAASATPFAAARLLNVVALGLGVLGLLLAARKLGWPVAGIAIVAAYALGNLATYSAYFMPEVLYGAVYILGCVALAVALADAAPASALAAGMALAGLTFIKPHGWVIVAVFAIYSAVFVWRTPQRARPGLRRSAVCGAAAFAVSWLGLQLALPDVTTRTGFLGTLYGGQVPGLFSTALHPARYADIAGLLGMHFVIVMVVAAPALLFGIRSTIVRDGATLDARERFAHALASLSLSALVALIGLVSLFTVSVAMPGSFESTNRLHGRLYTFAIPLLILASIGSSEARRFWSTNRAAVVTTWALACALCVVFLPRFVWYVDSPELYFGARAPKAAIAAFGAIGVFVAMGLRRSPAAVGIATLLAYTLASLVTGNIVRHAQLATAEGPADRAGKAASSMATQAGLPILIAEATNDIHSLITAFRIAAYAPLRARLVDPHALKVARDAKGGLTGIVVGPKDELADVFMRSRFDFGPLVVGMLRSDASPGDETHARPPASSEFAISFASPRDWPLASGLHPPENWGVWSSEPRITLRFSRPLSGVTRVKLRGLAMPENVGRPLLLHIGEDSRSFVLQKTATDVAVSIDLRTPTDTIMIDGYRQISPFDAGLSSDTRKLGIGLISMQIETAGNKAQ